MRCISSVCRTLSIITSVISLVVLSGCAQAATKLSQQVSTELTVQSPSNSGVNTAATVSDTKELVQIPSAPSIGSKVGPDSFPQGGSVYDSDFYKVGNYGVGLIANPLKDGGGGGPKDYYVIDYWAKGFSFPVFSRAKTDHFLTWVKNGRYVSYAKDTSGSVLQDSVQAFDGKSIFFRIPSDDGHSLYAEASEKSVPLGKISNDDEQFSMESLKIEGDWMQVRYYAPACGSCLEIACDSKKEQVGWIKWRSPERGPHVWFYSRGC